MIKFNLFNRIIFCAVLICSISFSASLASEPQSNSQTLKEVADEQIDDIDTNISPIPETTLNRNTTSRKCN